MKKALKILFITILFSSKLFGQGCSDAGFCTLQITKEVDNFLSKKHSAAIGLGYGTGLAEIKYFSSYLEYGYYVNEKISFQSRLTFQNANGPYANNSDLGDVFLTANYRLSVSNPYDFKFLIGYKMPLNNANTKNSLGNSLPLDYQTSLGTYDFILGTTLVSDRKWEFSVAAQIPVSNKNQNQFHPSNFPNSSEFYPSNEFKRGSDMLFRVGYIYSTPKSRFAFKPNLLFINRMESDRYKNNLGAETVIKGSNGLTLNAGLVAVVTLKSNAQLELNTAVPLAYHEVRPDGLTRLFVINLQYKVKF